MLERIHLSFRYLYDCKLSWKQYCGHDGVAAESSKITLDTKFRLKAGRWRDHQSQRLFEQRGHSTGNNCRKHWRRQNEGNWWFSSESSLSAVKQKRAMEHRVNPDAETSGEYQFNWLRQLVEATMLGVWTFDRKRHFGSQSFYVQSLRDENRPELTVDRVIWKEKRVSKEKFPFFRGACLSNRRTWNESSDIFIYRWPLW